MIGWPHKIEQQMEQTELQLQEDEERFHKLQMSDQANYNDRLDTLSVRQLFDVLGIQWSSLLVTTLWQKRSHV